MFLDGVDCDGLTALQKLQFFAQKCCLKLENRLVNVKFGEKLA